MKAYILSQAHGTIQIGDTVFQPCTGEVFKADRKGLAKKVAYTVSEKTMEAAAAIMRKHI